MDGQQTIPTSSSQENPLLDAAAAQLKASQAAVSSAESVLKRTSPYITGSAPSPQMPVPSLKSSLFSGASVHNLDREQPVTRAGARNKAVGQIAAQGAGIIGAYFKKKEAEKTQALAQDIHRSLELQQGLDEAQQVLAQDPNNVQAKATVQKNQALLTSLLNGKNGKDIAKAYDITFGKESLSTSHEDKQDSMHHNAMQDAMKQVKQDQAQKQQQDKFAEFEKQMPARMQANPAYQQALQNYNKTLDTAQKTQKNYLDYAAKIQGDQEKLEQARLKAESDQGIAQGKIDAAKEVERMRADASKYSADTRAHAELGAASIKAKAALKVARDSKIQGDKIRAATIGYQTMQGAIKDANDQITKLNTDLNQAKAKKDKTKEGQLQGQIDTLKSQILGAQTQQKDFELLMTDDPDASAVNSLLNDDNE